MEGVFPMSVCAASNGMVFYPFWSEIIAYGLFTQVLNWVCFLEEASS